MLSNYVIFALFCVLHVRVHNDPEGEDDYSNNDNNTVHRLKAL